MWPSQSPRSTAEKMCGFHLLVWRLWTTICCISMSHCDSQHFFFFLVWELRGTYKLDITNKYHYFTWENNINWIHFCLGIRLADMRMFLADSCFVWKFQVKRLFYLSPRKTTYLEMCFVWWPDLELPWEIYGLLNTTRAFSLQTLVSYMTFFLTDTFLVQIMSNLSIFL